MWSFLVLFFPPLALSEMYWAQAQQDHWIHIRGKSDGLRYRWRDFCTTYGCPYILVQEFRRGYCNVEVRLPFNPTVDQLTAIRGIGGQLRFELGLKRNGTRWEYSLNRDSLSVAVAVSFAQAMADLFADHFPAYVDHSWHL